MKDFIKKHINDNVYELLLKKSNFSKEQMHHIAQQIEGRQKSRYKLPSWVANDNILFGNKLSLEQCSSEDTAQFKAGLVKGNKLLDATGGFGVDSIFFAKRFSEVIYLEKNKELFEISKQNFETLGAKNVKPINTDCIDFLKKQNDKFDFIYIDPSRRNKGMKVFKFDDSIPDIINNLDFFMEKGDTILIKSSPLADIKYISETFSKYLNQIFIVSLKNECKEVLIFLSKKNPINVNLTCINIKKDRKISEFKTRIGKEEQEDLNFSLPQKYIYEPNASIMKAGTFKAIANRYKICKLHINSHLYTSNILKKDFQGKIFENLQILEFDKKKIKEHFPQMQANIKVRNFPIDVNTIRNKIKMKDGGDLFLIATTNTKNEKIIIKAKRIDKL